ncbi:MAG: outer membrane receptor protein involved in Fe transport [Sulfurimonas sp.]|uniref:TonB-dependent receptor plug domain-containing protein n=1 Tax=Sulfurimonas sp. TaxID=2022749 RepID=UPI0039E39026
MKQKFSSAIQKFSFVLLLLVSFTQLNAKENDILSSISNDIEHFNKVATLTKQNEHYQPYIISVFQGKELEKLGISNLKQALELVPGIDIATDNANTITPIFRGSNSLAYGQTKLFIDDVLVNNLFIDAYSEYLGLPVEMIKRIEVVRGPGSKTNGVNAYAGSIHIITYAEDFYGFEPDNKLVFKYGSYDYKMGGFVKTFKEKDLRIYIDFYYQQDNKKLPAGPDGLSQGNLSIPGLAIDNSSLSKNTDAPLWLTDYSLGLNLTYKNFSLKARMLDHTQGSAYGINLALPQDSDRLKLPSYYLELGYNKEINDFKVHINAGIKYDTFDSHSKLIPDGLHFIDIISYREDGTIIPITLTNGAYAEHLAKQRTLYQSTYIQYDGIGKHNITAGYRLSKEQTIGMVSKLSNRSTGDVALIDYTETLPFFDKNAKRNITILSLQDEFQFNNQISFIYGFNYEQTSYQDAEFEPRISMVYQLDSENIFKTIYSRSHRNASWQEMFTKNNSARVGNTNLKPEKVDAFEIAYIKTYSSDTYFQTNLFYLLNKDQISNSSTNPEYKNAVDTNIYGLEFEYNGHFSSLDKFYLNYSYVSGTAKIKNTGESEYIPNISHHLAKAYYIYDIDHTLALSGVAKYVSSKDRVSTDTREKVNAYSTVDATMSYKSLKYDYTLMLSVKNLFNADIKYASPPNTYSEDYTQERRNFLITLKKKF